jgi:ADP-ribosyl-[dinitrogen reductase] hydrolase
MTDEKDRYSGCLLGLACADAVGTTLEFKPRGTFTPITDMQGGGPFGLKAGEWTDDTSMALCLACSLVDWEKFDPEDQMARYLNWYLVGYMSSNGRCFDIGNTVRTALHQFQQTGNPFSGPTSPHSAGNGSIMRLAPVPMAYSPDVGKVIHYCGESSKTTHGAAECVDACKLFGVMLHLALTGATKAEILAQTLYLPTTPKLQAIAQGSYAHKPESQMRGTGYVVDSLEAALWCYYHTDDYETAVLAAANLGDDADTTAAVCGQLAGAVYGQSGIPEKWLEKLVMRDEMISLAEALRSSVSFA